MSGTEVLIIEDSPTSLKLLRLVLSLDGFDVRTAATAEHALQEMRERAPGLVVADIQLPGMSGLEFARLVRATPEWDDVTLVALSAHATKLDEQRARAAGYAGLIPKPMDTRTVTWRIHELLAKRSIGRFRDGSEATAT